MNRTVNDLKVELTEARAIIERLAEALTSFYVDYTNADDCYENPELFEGYLGRAVFLSENQETKILEAIQQSKAKARQDAADMELGRLVRKSLNLRNYVYISRHLSTNQDSGFSALDEHGVYLNRTHKHTPEAALRAAIEGRR